MLGRILIANRGEIAVRIVRACRELGIESVAIHSEADGDALHVRLADQAFCCGPPPARESYLDAARIVEIAAEAGAEGVHPGYGFLAENADFAERCVKAGLVFVGPAPEVIRLMGDKVASRRAMQEARVPIVPGTTARLSDAGVREAVAEIGYPVMVKASAGGGGRGLRLVENASQLEAALERARSEAASSFGDDGLYVEKALRRPRHVEIQVLADRHGNLVHLFERDCSAQRRHQKLLEEAPAPHLSPALRDRMGAAAVRAARAVGYEGIGTVEFLLDRDGEFYFLEMNTRIQVEHPVTEEITGVDLVKAMLRVAAGEPLPFGQEDLVATGHAIEARIYAEDPARGFLPSPGRVALFRPPDGPGIRVDAGVQSGSPVPVHYDPMLAKVVAHGADRDEAVARLSAALSETVVAGVRTTIPFHLRLLRHPRFLAGEVDTGIVDEVVADAAHADAEEAALLPLARRVAALSALEDAGLEGPLEVEVKGSEASGTIRVTRLEDGFRLEDDDGTSTLHLEGEAPLRLVRGERALHEVCVVTRGARGRDVLVAGRLFAFQCRIPDPA